MAETGSLGVYCAQNKFAFRLDRVTLFNGISHMQIDAAIENTAL